MHTTRILGSQTPEDIDSEAVTVRTPNLPPIVMDGGVDEEEAPIPLVRSHRPMSLRAPASKANEAGWFEKEETPAFVAPGVPEIAEPLSASLAARHGFEPRSTRGVGFAIVALMLAGVVAAGSVFLFSSRTADEAKVTDTTSTTRLTSAEAPPAPATSSSTIMPVVPSAAAPETTSAAKPLTTVQARDLPESRADRAIAKKKVTTPATVPDLAPDDRKKARGEDGLPPPSPDSPTTPPDLVEKP